MKNCRIFLNSTWYSLSLNALTCSQDVASLLPQASRVAICIELLSNIEATIIKNEPRVSIYLWPPLHPYYNTHTHAAPEACSGVTSCSYLWHISAQPLSCRLFVAAFVALKMRTAWLGATISATFFSPFALILCKHRNQLPALSGRCRPAVMSHCDTSL